MLIFIPPSDVLCCVLRFLRCLFLLKILMRHVIWWCWWWLLFKNEEIYNHSRRRSGRVESAQAHNKNKSWFSIQQEHGNNRKRPYHTRAAWHFLGKWTENIVVHLHFYETMIAHVIHRRRGPGHLKLPTKRTQYLKSTRGKSAPIWCLSGEEKRSHNDAC